MLQTPPSKLAYEQSNLLSQITSQLWRVSGLLVKTGTSLSGE